MSRIQEFFLQEHAAQLMIPAGAQILTVMCKEDELFLYVLIPDETASSFMRSFHVYDTNRPIPQVADMNLHYVGSASKGYHGERHVFEAL